MNRIAVVGCGGAGKSTFSRELSKVLNIPVYHLDALFWNPGWVKTSKDKWQEIMKNLVSKDEWIIEGNYGKTLDIRLENADTIIFLNMPTYLCIYRIIKRRFMYSGKTRPDMKEGCPEKLDWEFISWVWNFNKNKKPWMLKKLKAYSGEKNIVILNKPSEVDKYIAYINRSIKKR